MKKQYHPEAQAIAENRRGTKTHRKYVEACRVLVGPRGHVCGMRLDAMLASTRAVKKVIAKLELGQCRDENMAGRMQRRIARNLMSAYSEALESSIGY